MGYLKSGIKAFKKNISNIQGWSSKDKIVVFEVDDWGAVRTRSREARDNMINKGLKINNSRFDYYDSLANKKDLESLFEVLAKFKDINNNSPVFTAVSVVANPDFKKIKDSGFNEYYYETLQQSLERYYGNENVIEVWKQGIDAGIFYPEFHGREHLNPGLWLDALKNGDKNVLTAFEHESLGPKSTVLKNYIGGYLSAFDYKDIEDRDRQKEVIEQGLKIFSDLFGYKARHFTSSGLIHHPDIEQYLKKSGVDYIDVAKKQIEPQGNGKYKNKMYTLGSKNNNGQVYITRNSRFEPNDQSSKNWVSDTMSDIEIAFRWNKPAVISSHRVNYVGAIEPNNRVEGLKQLDSLLSQIVKRWPDVQFMSVTKLADLIQKANV